MQYCHPAELEDFSINTTELIFQPGGNQTRCVEVLIANDLVVEKSESFTVQLNTAEPDVILLGVDTAIVTIINEDSKLAPKPPCQKC